MANFIKSKKRNFRKRFSAEEKFQYHGSRCFGPKKFGITFGSHKHMYSVGFYDGFNDVNNYNVFKRIVGYAKANTYANGNKRGQKVAIEYFKKT